MKDRQLKALIKGTYTFNESASEREFLRSHEERSMQFWDIVKTELGFMGWKAIIAGIALFFILLKISMGDESNAMWCISSVLPIFAMMMSIMIGKSERHSMDELEFSCRFSLRFVNLIRMLILGATSLLIIILCIVIVGEYVGDKIFTTMCYVSLPYLINVLLGIIVTRRMHKREEVFILTGATLFTCLLPTVAKEIEMLSLLGNLGLKTLSIIALLMIIVEANLYIREGDKRWNYC